MTPNVGNNNQSGISMSQMNLPIISKDAGLKNVEKLNSQEVKEMQMKHEEPVAQETAAEPKVEEPKAEEPKAEESKVEEVKSQEPQTFYCIVLASQVSQHNAELFVKKLQDKGISNARVYLSNNIRRVICGQFSTEAEAYRELQKMHRNEELADAWVYKVRQ
jgi:cell division septation protein DedD